MTLLIPPHTKVPKPYVEVGGVFTLDELDKLEAMATEANETGAVLGGADQVRHSLVRFLNYAPDMVWLYERMSQMVAGINANLFNYDLICWGEQLQLARYGMNGKYDWHQDYQGGVSRKLSVSVQLTDPAKYEGGDLELINSMHKASRERGTVILFPSFQLHRVTEVTVGVRYSLVGWVSGPPWR
jgi:PKHD-type hydroxylase